MINRLLFTLIAGLPFYAHASNPEEPEQWRLFCTPHDSRCFDKDASEIATAPTYPLSHKKNDFNDSDRLTLKQFYAEGSGTLDAMIDENTFLLTPSDGEQGRLYKLASHHQKTFPLKQKKAGSILMKIAGTRVVDAKPSDRKSGLNHIRQTTVPAKVSYRCFGLYHSGAASCLVRELNSDKDIGERLLSNGFLEPTDGSSARYQSAYSFAKHHKNGYLALNTQNAIYSGIRKDRYGVCWNTGNSNNLDRKFFSYYENMDDCLQSGGIDGTVQ